MIYTTAQDTPLRLSVAESLDFRDCGSVQEKEPGVFFDPLHTFQTIVGIGGALTDAAAETFFALTPEQQAELLTRYYDPEAGIGYSLGRTNIGSCDFSSETYTYVADDDAELGSFNIQHDLEYKVPFIKAALRAAGGKLPLFASPWSPPAWMKDNRHALRGGKLLPRYRQAWAKHYVRFVEEYEKIGLPIWGLSVQNEPMASQTWESCVYTADEERDFIKDYLGPTLATHGMRDKKLIAWDHNRDLIFHRASTILNDPEAAKYVWGIGFHWYETWMGGEMQFENVRMVHESFPSTNLMLTEACVEKFDFARLDEWALAERYGISMIGDFNAGAVGWTDWNVLLDENGGPNHVGNYCFSPVHSDSRTGELIFTNSFYYIGHFSKFIRPGAKRIASTTNRSDLLTTAFINEDGKIVLIVLNKSDKEINYLLWRDGKAAEMNGRPHSITTVVL